MVFLCIELTVLCSSRAQGWNVHNLHASATKCDQKNTNTHLKHSLSNIIAKVPPFSRSLFVQLLSPWKQIRSISLHPKDYM